MDTPGLSQVQQFSARWRQGLDEGLRRAGRRARALDRLEAALREPVEHALAEGAWLTNQALGYLGEQSVEWRRMGLEGLRCAMDVLLPRP